MQSSSKQPTERLNIMSQENDLIHVAIYTHEYGTSVRTFTNIEMRIIGKMRLVQNIGQR